MVGRTITSTSPAARLRLRLRRGKPARSDPHSVPLPGFGWRSFFIALFSMHHTAWLPPLTILWTRCADDLDAVTPKIVKDGTPDQRALLQARFPSTAQFLTSSIEHPASKKTPGRCPGVKRWGFVCQFLRSGLSRRSPPVASGLASLGRLSRGRFSSLGGKSS